ncbi:MAG TPA: hypothetical protein VGM88_17425 [Kofleriaceae bacterium]|jgi:hypothetical protein
MRWLVILTAMAAALPGCHHGGGPDRALDGYGRALADHDYGRAYDLMSASFRSRTSREDYVRMMRDNPKEVAETADRLRHHRGGVEVSAELEYGLGDSLRLVQEGGAWRIASNPLAFYDQSTPKAALRSFIRAYRLGRWDVMLRFVPNSYREKMDVKKLEAQFTGPSKDQMELLINTLEANVDQPITERGNDARMVYGDRFNVQFLKEDGLWKLKDLD